MITIVVKLLIIMIMIITLAGREPDGFPGQFNVINSMANA